MPQDAEAKLARPIQFENIHAINIATAMAVQRQRRHQQTASQGTAAHFTENQSRGHADDCIAIYVPQQRVR